MRRSELKQIIKECLVEESENKSEIYELKKFIDGNKAHFTAFLKPARIIVKEHVDNTLTIVPGSNSFTITVDFNTKEIQSTGKPTKGMESVSYIEMLEFLKVRTKFTVVED
jgi:predicted component of type VI protein secretion system